MSIKADDCIALIELIERLENARGKGTVDRTVATDGITKATAELNTKLNE